MKRVLIAAALLVAAASILSATPLIGRGAGTMKPKQFLGEIDFGYSQTGQKYNWTDSKWDDLADTLKTTTISAAFIAGIAPLKNWEVLFHVPLAAKSQGSKSALGVGDVELHTRYALLADKKDKKAPVKLTGVAALGLPTADKSASPKIGDGKMSGAVGLIATTKSFGKAVGHLRAAYWLNGSYKKTVGELEQTHDVGEMLEYVVKVDYNLSKKVQFWGSLVGTMQGKTKVNGTAVDNTEQDRHIGQLGAVIMPISVLSIRPKVGLPIAAVSKGGSIAPFTVGLDFWVIASEKK